LRNLERNLRRRPGKKKKQEWSTMRINTMSSNNRITMVAREEKEEDSIKADKVAQSM
jgi:hypothetical protein